MDPIIYTNATITTSPIKNNLPIPATVHIRSEDPVGSIVIILTQDEFTGKLKSWLRSLPMEQRQMIIDELVACTLRTLEATE